MTEKADGGAREEEMRAARVRMVALIRARGFADERVLRAMLEVRRHVFFPQAVSDPAVAYGDFPVPIGWGATISQPFIVAYMTGLLRAQAGSRVLEIGTGSGYQAAVLAALGARVWSLEVVQELAGHARRCLEREGYTEVRVRCANGYGGWLEEAPFDGIIATCAPTEVPEELARQLAAGGRMVVPVGVQGEAQRLVVVRREGGGLSLEEDIAVRFVPMVR